MSNLIIKNGRVIDPSQGIDRVTNLLIAEGRIAALDAPEDSAGNGHAESSTEVIDAEGKIVSPGLIDMEVHLREPGGEEDETIDSGTAAALAGGFTSIVCSPDTDPPVDTRAAVEFIQHRAAKADHCNVFVLACVSKGRAGEELAEIGQLAEAGAVGFSDDDAPIYSPELMRRAFEYCLMFDKPILNHPETRELTRAGVMHEGLVSLRLALGGMPAAAEDVMTSRDISLAEATGGRVHLMHLSSAGSVEAICRAKSRGVQVTAAVCPHHMTLTDELLDTFDSNYKINPPLRGRNHCDALVAGLADGTIDVIASDHSPRAVEKKMQELDLAPFGVVGLETTLGVISTALVAPGHLDWPTVLAKLTINPARILGLDRGTLAVGAPADVTVIDPHARWTVDPRQFRSKSRNTSFAGWELQGRADVVVVGGRVKWTSESGKRKAESGK